MCVLSCLALCDPLDCSLPGSSVHGILEERILEWVAISRKLHKQLLKMLTRHIQLLGILYKIMLQVSTVTESESRSVLSDSVTPWTVCGILQARILGWVAFPFFRGSSRPRNRTQVSRIALNY